MSGRPAGSDRAPGKRAAGNAAAELVRAGMRLGLGTGSTVAAFLTAVAERDLDVAGVATSEQTAQQCRRLGIGLLDPMDVGELDLTVDGADELTGRLALTKGGGGALLREKVVAAMSSRVVIVATPDKQVDRLGDSFPLPVEVVDFALGPVTRRLRALGFGPTVRDGGRYRTDNGNLIVDCRMQGGIADPVRVAAQLSAVPGIAEHGLFIDLTDTALLGHDDGSVTELTRRPTPG